VSFNARATIFVVALISVLSVPRGLAYDEHTTHPALTQEIVKFYNLSYPDKPITTEEAEWIIQGSTNEDQWPRWINHFYDPVREVGWTGEHTGTMPAEVVRAVSGAGLSLEKPTSAVEWLNSYLTQATYGRYGGNRTWKRGLEYYANGDKEEGYRTLGHALHLLEDMSVPEHTRNDTHAHDLEGVTGDPGSPYEAYTEQWTRQTITKLQIPEALQKENIVPIGAGSIDEHLKALAKYSNQYFFTKDTINDPKYALPKIVREGDGFGYGRDENGKEFPLVRRKADLDEKGNTRIIYSLASVEEEKILDAYFSRLSRQAILRGADAVRLFKKQAEDEIVNKDFPQHIVQVDVDFYGRLFPNFSLATEMNRLASGASGWANRVTAGIANVVSAMRNSVSGAVSDVIGLFETNSGTDGLTSLNPSNSPQSDSRPIQSADDGDNENGSEGEERSEEGADETTSGDFVSLQSQIDGARATLGLLFQSGRTDTNAPTEIISPTSNQLVQTTPTSIISSSGGGGGGGGVTATPAPITTENNAPSSGTTSETVVTTTTTTTTTDATSTLSNNTSTTPQTVTPAPPTPSPIATHVVISEVQVAGDGGAGDEFVELYNPTNADIDISNWSLQYISGHATSAQSVARKNFSTTSTIPALGYFLIARGKNNSNADGYMGSKLPDIAHRSFSLSGATTGGALFLVGVRDDITGADDPRIIDRLAYGAIAERSFAEGNSAPVPPADSSLMRKSADSSSCDTPVGEKEFVGNGCDRGTNSDDFELVAVSNPQNARSMSEPRQAPASQNSRAVFASSSMEIIVQWDVSTDVRGATSTNIYRIYDLSNGTTTPKGAVTSSLAFSFAVSEVGRGYPIDFIVEDEDGMRSHTTTTVAVRSFLTRAHFYRDTRAGGTEVFDMFYNARPFIPGILSVPNNGATFWQGVVLYVNRTPNESNRFLNTSGSFHPSDTNGAVTLQASGPSNKSAVFALDGGHANGAGGGLNNSSFLLPSEDGHLALTLAARATSSASDYLTIAYYDFCQSGGGQQTLCLVATDANRYPLLASLPSQDAPTVPANVTSTFSENDGTLTLRWASSTDADTPDGNIAYEVHYTTSTSLGGDDWHDARGGALPSFTFNPAFPQSPYLLGIRAKDDFGNTSAIATSTWSFPDGYAPLPSQLEHGTRIAEFARGNSQKISIAGTVTISSIALWISKAGGNSCCASSYLEVRTASSTVVATSTPVQLTAGFSDQEKIYQFGSLTLAGPAEYLLVPVQSGGNETRIYGSNTDTYAEGFWSGASGKDAYFKMRR
jgi:hypothetical protein